MAYTLQRGELTSNIYLVKIYKKKTVILFQLYRCYNIYHGELVTDGYTDERTSFDVTRDNQHNDCQVTKELERVLIFAICSIVTNAILVLCSA